ncbi:MAG: TetR/AcrR family transcriptional regulator [Myxococcota bacterium]
MPRRKAWNGTPPQTPAEARRILLDHARTCLERLGPARASLSDVATAAGVTRQTVYRYFDNADDLFRSAAVLATGGFHERMRQAAMMRDAPVERIIECVVFCVLEIPKDPDMLALGPLSEHFTLETGLGFVREEMAVLAGSSLKLSERSQDEFAEVLVRLLHSLLSDPGVPRTEGELRAFLVRWLVPAVEALSEEAKSLATD